MPLPIITEIKSRDNFLNRIKTNPGLFFIKFGAEWCVPCKQIEQEVLQYFNNMPDNVQCAIIDIDDNFEIYAFLKTKKMVKGIPTILCYRKENDSYIPDESFSGADKDGLKEFIDNCLSQLD